MPPGKLLALGPAGTDLNPLGGPEARTQQNYLNGVNRDYARNFSGISDPGEPISWIKSWANWAQLQQNYGGPGTIRNPYDSRPPDSPWGRPPPNYWASFYDLNSRQNFWNDEWGLDAQIRAANEDGKAIVLTLYPSFPLWSSSPSYEYDLERTRREKKARADRNRLEINAQLPDDVRTNSPWGWFCAYLLLRYKYQQGTNGGFFNPHRGGDDFGGPSPLNLYGNPRRAFVHAIEVCNEFNRQTWPKTAMGYGAASTMRTAVLFSAAYANQPYPYGQASAIFGPGTSDGIDGDPSVGPGNPGMDSREFARSVIDNWGTAPSPANVYLGWSHHNYTDVEQPSTRRLAAARAELRAPSSNGAVFPNRAHIWLTEGGHRIPTKYATIARRGYNPDHPEEVRQRNNVISSWNAVQQSFPEVIVFAQYLVGALEPMNDRFSSELREVDDVTRIYYLRKLFYHFARLR